MDKKHCVGCRDNFYNFNSTDGQVHECWMLAEATLKMRRRVHTNDMPPWTREPELLPGCYREPHFVFVEPTVER